MVKVTLGKKASIFHDPSTGVTVYKNQVVELDNKILLSKRIRSALNGGHLVYAVEEKDTEAIDINPIKEKFINLVKSGKEPSKISKAFNIDQLKALARSYDIEPEEEDTKEILVVAIIEEVSGEVNNDTNEDA